jgi:hypothetical protein
MWFTARFVVASWGPDRDKPLPMQSPFAPRINESIADQGLQNMLPASALSTVGQTLSARGGLAGGIRGFTGQFRFGSADRARVDLFLKWFAAIKGGKSRLSDLTTADLLSYRQHLVNVARLRSSTINQRLQAIRCLCRWAERQGFLKSTFHLPERGKGAVRRRCPSQV